MMIVESFRAPEADQPHRRVEAALSPDFRLGRWRALAFSSADRTSVSDAVWLRV